MLYPIELGLRAFSPPNRRCELKTIASSHGFAAAWRRAHYHAAKWLRKQGGVNISRDIRPVRPSLNIGAFQEGTALKDVLGI